MLACIEIPCILGNSVFCRILIYFSLWVFYFLLAKVFFYWIMIVHNKIYFILWFFFIGYIYIALILSIFLSHRILKNYRVYRHGRKWTDLNAGIVHTRTHMKISVSFWGISAQIRMFYKYILWPIKTSKRNYVCKLWIATSFLWFVCSNIIQNFGCLVIYEPFYQAIV